MKEKIFLTTVILLLLTSITSGILFPSKNSYSYLNQIENFGRKSLFELVFTNNRLLKNKVDYIFQSTVKICSETMAEFVEFAKCFSLTLNFLILKYFMERMESFSQNKTVT